MTKYLHSRLGDPARGLACCPRTRHSRCSPRPRTGPRSRTNSAATRSTCTPPPAPSRTCIAWMPSRAWSRARASADLVVATGADLEIGWMPVLLQDSGNTRSSRAAPATSRPRPLVHLLEVPSAVDRSMGDIHPLGNPHVAPRSAQHRHHRRGPDRAPGAGGSGQRGVLRARAARTSRRAGRPRRPRSGRPQAAPLKGIGGRRDPPRPGVPVQLAGTEGARGHRAEARRAAERRLPGRAGHQARRHAAEDDPAQRLQRLRRRPTGWPSASTPRWCCCRTRSAARRRRRICSACSMTRSTACWRRPRMNTLQANSQHPVAGAHRRHARGALARAARASRCSRAASCSSTWRSRRSPGSA